MPYLHRDGVGTVLRVLPLKASGTGGGRYSQGSDLPRQEGQAFPRKTEQQ